MLKAFRVVSMLEGFSYIAVLSITLGFVSRDFVSQLGMIHGVLFMLYISLAMAASNKQRWSPIVFPALFAASLIPFAFIAVEGFLSRQKTSQQPIATQSEH